MKRFLKTAVWVSIITVSLFAQQPGFRDNLLSRMLGDWVLKGEIEGKEVTHHVTAEWVLMHQYLLIHERSKEKDGARRPLYEAYVYVGWDDAAKEYVCVWLDVFGGISSQSFGRAKACGDEIPFVFKNDKDGGAFYTTFKYNKDEKSWQWTMDSEKEGKRQAFARVKLTRK